MNLNGLVTFKSFSMAIAGYGLNVEYVGHVHCVYLTDDRPDELKLHWKINGVNGLQDETINMSKVLRYFGLNEDNYVENLNMCMNTYQKNLLQYIDEHTKS